MIIVKFFFKLISFIAKKLGYLVTIKKIKYNINYEIVDKNSWTPYLNFNDNKNGFMFSDNPLINEIGNYKKVLNDGHSGCSFAITLRVSQQILKYEESTNIITSYQEL